MNTRRGGDGVVEETLDEEGRRVVVRLSWAGIAKKFGLPDHLVLLDARFVPGGGQGGSTWSCGMTSAKSTR